MRIMKQAQEAGLVTQPATAANPGGICNCCGDCCGVLRSLNRHPEPASMVFSNYFAEVEPDRCTGCETCVDMCQMGAVSMDDEGRARIDLKRCIGCGLCVMSCPVEALRLVTKPEGELRTPPADTREQQEYLARLVGRA